MTSLNKIERQKVLWADLPVFDAVDELDAEGRSIAKLTLVNALTYMKESEQPFYRFRLFCSQPKVTKFMNAMRSQLSRIRRDMRDLGTRPQQFSLFVHDVTVVNERTQETIVTIAKNISPLKESLNMQFSDVLSREDEIKLDISKAVSTLRQYAPQLLKEQGNE